MIKPIDRQPLDAQFCWESPLYSPWRLTTVLDPALA
jgi:hypothetical protein